MAKSVHIREVVEVPEGVEVSIEGMKVTVRGPKGEVVKDFSHARGILLALEEGGRSVVVESFFADAKKRALAYTIVAHVRNMITGVTRGWRYKLKIVSSHFPVTAKVVGNEVWIENFLGERAPRRARILGGVNVRVEGKDIIVEGADLEAVAQTAANIELATKVKDKDRRVFVDGVYIYERGEAS